MKLKLRGSPKHLLNFVKQQALVVVHLKKNKNIIIHFVGKNNINKNVLPFEFKESNHSLKC